LSGVVVVHPIFTLYSSYISCYAEVQKCNFALTPALLHFCISLRAEILTEDDLVVVRYAGGAVRYNARTVGERCSAARRSVNSEPWESAMALKGGVLLTPRCWHNTIYWVG